MVRVFFLTSDSCSYIHGIRRKDNMSELIIKTARENEDLPKRGYPIPPYKSKKLEPITLGDYKIEFKDMLNPTTLREWFGKVNGQK